MELIRCDSPAGFAEVAMPFLMAAEAENNLIISILDAIQKGKYTDPYLALGQDDDGTRAAALMTPPHHLLLTRASDAFLKRLARDLNTNGPTPAGVIGPDHTAGRFAMFWADLTGQAYHLHMAQRTFALRKVIPPRRPADGRFRRATEGDRVVLMRFAAGFFADTHSVVHVPVGKYIAQGLRERRFFVWEDGRGQVVSMAATAGGETPNGQRIGAVYTPVRSRNRGYAAACVAALSQHVLDSRKHFCFLFADLANPTANGIYRRLGYRPVCDFNQYCFE
jgi:predicted GNAT family acetyltransferase